MHLGKSGKQLTQHFAKTTLNASFKVVFHIFNNFHTIFAIELGEIMYQLGVMSVMLDKIRDKLGRRHDRA